MRRSRRPLGGVAVLLLLNSARCAPVPESTWAAVSGCAALKEAKNTLDVATAGMVVGAACDADEHCCWVVAGSSPLPLVSDDVLTLNSLNSLALRGRHPARRRRAHLWVPCHERVCNGAHTAE